MSNSEPFGGKVIVFGVDSTRFQTVNYSLVKSFIWQKIEILMLIKNMRAKEDKVFGEFLLRVGNGIQPTIHDDLILFPEKMVIKYESEKVCEDALIDVFVYLEEFLNTLLPNGLPSHKLVLKANFPIILLRKLDPSNSLCNVTRMVCERFDNYVKHVEIIIGQYAEKQVFFPRIPLSLAENEGYPFSV
uniref:ATP-dependent DNA helicase n=1 Tax=Gossypium raimondii TaxID=29730 RepID=A0A0D2TKH5_GOSRA|nr:hypothetical protein B456_007G239500 [Gossypium raimondii]